MGKRLYLSMIMHANMLYDRFGRDEILDKFPKMYRYVVRSVEKYPAMRIGFELSGVTILMLKRHAPDVLDGIRHAVKAKRAIVLGTYFSNPLNMCTDEYFNYQNAWLGVEIVKRELGEPSGFYPQENSYHPGMPSIIRRLGLTWMTVPAILGKRPFHVKGLNNDTTIGLPTEVVDAENLDRLYDEYPDNSIIAPIVDSEYHPNFDVIMSKIAQMNETGRQIEWISVPDYLSRFKAEESRDCPPCTSVDTIYARWITSPENVKLHEATMEAMKLYHDAAKLKDMIRAQYGKDVDIPYQDTVLVEEKNVVTAEIEDLSCLPDIAGEYLAKGATVSTLTRALYLLLWAMNSDARGWYPLVQKTRQRADDLALASALCKDVIDRGLSLMKKEMGHSEADVMLLYNPHMKKDFDVHLGLGKALEFNNVSRNHVSNLKSASGVETILRLQGDRKSVEVLECRSSPTFDKFRWEAGTSIRNASSALSLKDYSLEYRHDDRNMTVYLSMPALVEVKNGTIETDFIKYFSFKPVLVEIGKKMHPCMRVGRKLNESIYVTEYYSLQEDRLECEWEFFFPRSVILGNLTWETNTIEAVVKGGFTKVHGNIPGGIIDYELQNGRITALNYAIADGDGGGVSLVSLTGSQGFRLNGQKGELAVSLGASTLGPSSVPALMTIDPECTNGSGIYQFEKFGYVTFNGTYRHRFVILPFTGSRQESGIDVKAELCNKNVYVY